jgi:hypothetical protein
MAAMQSTCAEHPQLVAGLVCRQNKLVMGVLGVISVATNTPVNVTVGCPFEAYAVRVNVPE